MADELEFPSWCVASKMFDQWIQRQKDDHQHTGNDYPLLFTALMESIGMRTQMGGFLQEVDRRVDLHITSLRDQLLELRDDCNQISDWNDMAEESIFILDRDRADRNNRLSTLAAGLAALIRTAEELRKETAIYEDGEELKSLGDHADQNNRLSTLGTGLDALIRTAEDLQKETVIPEDDEELKSLGDGHHPRSCLPVPPQFTGMQIDPARRQKSYVEWKFRVLLKLTVDRSTCADAQSRILYTGACLGGPALGVVRNKMNMVTANTDPNTWPVGWRDYKDVFTTLDQVYIVVDLAARAKRDLAHLRQTGRLSDFVTKFVQLVEEAELTPKEQVVVLREKVDVRYQDMLIGNTRPPDDYDVLGWIRLFRKYDQQLQDAEFQASPHRDLYVADWLARLAECEPEACVDSAMDGEERHTVD